MNACRAGASIIVGTALLTTLVMSGCVQVLTETAKKAREDRTTGDQVTDGRIGAGILSRLSSRDKGLLLDVNVDVWEQRVLLTGTLSDPKVRGEVVQLVRQDQRVRQVYDEIQIVSKGEQEARRQQAEKEKQESPSGARQGVSDFWISTKVEAQLVGAGGVRSVNYRWRSVGNTVYIIGRARSAEELNKVLEICRATNGVRAVKQFVEVKPVTD